MDMPFAHRQPKEKFRVCFRGVLVVVAALICAAGYASVHRCHVTPDDVVSWWSGESNALDNLGLNPGIPINAPAYAPGKAGSAFDLNGARQCIFVPDSPSLHFTNSLTVEAWVFPRAYHPPASSILVKFDGTSGVNQSCFSFSINVPERTFYLLVSGDGSPYGSGQCNSSNLVPVNQWTHLAATYDGDTIKVYFNGKLDSTRKYTGGIFPGKDNMAIGANVGGLSRNSPIALFDGLIDEVTIYRRALSAEEIEIIYHSDASPKHSEPSDH
jgi:hypothetical protein